MQAFYISPEITLRQSSTCGGWDGEASVQGRQVVLLLDVLGGEEERVGVRGERKESCLLSI